VDDWRADQIGLITALLQQHADPGAAVGILGLTYKPGVDIVDESPGLKVAATLREAGVSVVCFDPSVQSKEYTNAATLEDAVARCGVLLIATPWADFQALAAMDLTGKVTVDLWGMFEDDELTGRYVRLGKGA
jgi:UDP-N-acetyl-D-mannosaminuronic acid dehydrogenase